MKIIVIYLLYLALLGAAFYLRSLRIGVPMSLEYEWAKKWHEYLYGALFICAILIVPVFTCWNFNSVALSAGLTSCIFIVFGEYKN